MTDPIIEDRGVPDDPAEFAEWVKHQPAPIRKAAKVFPIGTSPIVPIKVYIVGYTEGGDAVALLNDPATMTPEQMDAEVRKGLLLDPDQFREGGPAITHEAVGRH